MKLYIYATNIEEVLKGDFRWSLTASGDDDLSATYGLIAEVDVELNLDREKLTGVAMDSLDNDIKEIKAKTTAAITTLEARKQNLLALTAQ